MSKKRAAYVVVAAALAAVFAAGAGAGASRGGKLDRSFGDGGRAVVSGIRECLSGEGGCWAGVGMAIQRNGAIVIAGGTLDSDCGSRFAVARLRKSGRPDRTFGADGRVLTSFGSSSAVAHAVVILPDNRIVVGGELLDTTFPCPDHLHLGYGGKGFALARYRSDGTLDPTFGRGGRVVTHFDEGAGLDVVLQPDRKIVVVGMSKGRVALARYSRDGNLDPSFGGTGTVIGHFQIQDFTGKAALDKAGRILVPVSGWCYPCSPYVVRYTRNGRLDETFGRRGRAATPLLSITAVATFRGQIVVAGIADRGAPAPRLAVSRLSSTGKPDRKFGQNGTRVLPVPWAWQPDLVIQKNGVILVAAGARRPGAKGFENYDFTLNRILPDGIVDRSFGRQGTIRDDFGRRDFGQEVAVQPNGKLLIAGVVGRVADGVGLARHLR
jgi:uncharacterized delta-60 repeat protein